MKAVWMAMACAFLIGSNTLSQTVVAGSEQPTANTHKTALPFDSKRSRLELGLPFGSYLARLLEGEADYDCDANTIYCGKPGEALDRQYLAAAYSYRVGKGGSTIQLTAGYARQSSPIPFRIYEGLPINASRWARFSVEAAYLFRKTIEDKDALFIGPALCYYQTRSGYGQGKKLLVDPFRRPQLSGQYGAPGIGLTVRYEHLLGKRLFYSLNCSVFYVRNYWYRYTSPTLNYYYRTLDDLELFSAGPTIGFGYRW